MISSGEVPLIGGDVGREPRGHAKRDLMVPSGGWPNNDAANEAARACCAEVNAAVHSEIAAVPEVCLPTEQSVLRPLPSLRPAFAPTASRKVDRLRTVRYART